MPGTSVGLIVSRRLENPLAASSSSRIRTPIAIARKSEKSAVWLATTSVLPARAGSVATIADTDQLIKKVRTAKSAKRSQK